MEGVKTADKSEVTEADRINVISMLYDGAINFTKKAGEKIELGDTPGRTLHIRKTEAIIRELSGSLNMDGGEIAQNLKRLYDFILDNLKKAEEQNSAKALDEVVKVLDILSDAWQEMQEASKAEHRSKNGVSTY